VDILKASFEETMLNKNHFDVIIVGAGPAGISTALHLAQISPEFIGKTVILEKATHPRPKLCGGGLLPDAETVLQQLGLDIGEIPHVDVDWAHFDFEGRGFRFRPDPRLPYAFRTIRRHEFDAWLAAKARQRGFLIHENTCVKSITVTGSGVGVTTNQGEYHAAVVVGADGSNSLVRRAILPRQDQHVARLLEVVTGLKADQSFHKQSNSYFDFVVVPQGIHGYVWDFPAVEQGKPVRVRGIYDGNVFLVKTRVPLRSALEQEFGRHGLQLSDYKLEGHPIRWFEAGGPFSAPRILLAGDAAGADVLFGEGISFALGYGGLAAGAIRDAFDRQDFSFGNYRRDILHSEMGKALCLRTWMARFFYGFRSRHLQAFVWRKMGWFVEWAMRAFFIGWAKREERKNRQGEK
jgi:menaquinone-9 beta-reductase